MRAKPGAPPEQPPELLEILPRRLFEVAALIADGYSERDVGDRLGITRYEVRNRLEEMGPIWLGYNLHCLPNSWEDAVVLRGEIEKCWRRALKKWKTP